MRAGALFVGQRLHFRIAAERRRGREVGLRLREFAKTLDDRIDFGTLSRERTIAVHVARRIFGGEQMMELGEARFELVELKAERGFHEFCVSFPRTRESILNYGRWVPVCARTTELQRYDSPDEESGSL